jgi:hypothetical protein
MANERKRGATTFLKAALACYKFVAFRRALQAARAGVINTRQQTRPAAEQLVEGLLSLHS